MDKTADGEFGLSAASAEAAPREPPSSFRFRARGMLRVHADDELAASHQRLSDARLFPDRRGMTAAILA